MIVLIEEVQTVTVYVILDVRKSATKFSIRMEKNTIFYFYISIILKLYIFICINTFALPSLINSFFLSIRRSSAIQRPLQHYFLDFSHFTSSCLLWEVIVPTYFPFRLSSDLILQMWIQPSQPDHVVPSVSADTPSQQSQNLIDREDRSIISFTGVLCLRVTAFALLYLINTPSLESGICARHLSYFRTWLFISIGNPMSPCDIFHTICSSTCHQYCPLLVLLCSPRIRVFLSFFFIFSFLTWLHYPSVYEASMLNWKTYEHSVLVYIILMT